MALSVMFVAALVVGGLARRFYPGFESVGLVQSVILGAGGSFVGALLFVKLYPPGRLWELHPLSVTFSVVGAAAGLFLYAKIRNLQPSSTPP